MAQHLDKRPLLNRPSLHRLQQADMGELAEALPDINAARRLALWHHSSGSDTYMLVLLTAATRQVALGYFAEIGLQPGTDKIALGESTYPLPELGEAYAKFLDCYPARELDKAVSPGVSTKLRSARRRLLTEIFVLEALIDNPAAQIFHDLFDDAELLSRFDYHRFIKEFTAFAQPSQPQSFHGQTLPEILRAPMRKAPNDLAEQLSYIATHWSAWLPQDLLGEMQLASAIAAEENRPHLPGPGPSPVPNFDKGDGSNAPAAFTADNDWMANSVLIAKSIYVWLDQLGTRYQRPVTTLSDIPDEELACLAGWGFNALWLIGIWERSTASRRIKQTAGNPEAEASAYALHAYRVAGDLGGENALRDLEQRCQNHGIRLACDVVPNHTGIDSELVIQHPDWFLQADQPPYPAYSFSGPDLCEANEVSIRIEDGYWDHSDAAVVYEYQDHRSGQRRYIYHGNDGTHMPWNDTAQLNFLVPEVRQAMSDLIVAIARRFSLIRFDAAMTLARKHFRRLWFPPPGGSAGVPSRSSYWMSDADFEAAFPVEFWREVVDRINREVPETLLIAEAFWMMESYFVRNLGMHRVYNSAFMNMLKREENAKYRKIIKDILAYNPEILKRYVNFMNNPDEATAVEQFDKGDKYFGVATLLATLPGLPMFGHGQIEGYREKYGMEYRRAYWQESPDSGFVAHHKQQVFPLLRMRQIFSGVENFSFYDFTTAHGVDENVYAFSNGAKENKFLVVYNNSARPTTGRVHNASPKAEVDREGAAQPMPPLYQELNLDQDNGKFCRFCSLQGREYLQHVDQLTQGLELTLNSYEHLVFHDFQLFDDSDGQWQRLHQHLQGRAVDNLDRELLRMLHEPLWQMFTELLKPGRLHALIGGLTTLPHTEPVKELIAELDNELRAFAKALCPSATLSSDGTVATDLKKLCEDISGWLSGLSAKGFPGKLLARLWYGERTQQALGVPLITWLLLHRLGEIVGLTDTSRCLQLLREFGLDYAWQETMTTAEHEQEMSLVILLLQTASLSQHPATTESAFSELCNASENVNLLDINKHAGETWFSREGMTNLAATIALQAEILQLTNGSQPAGRGEPAPDIPGMLRQRLARAAAVGYRLDKFLSLG